MARISCILLHACLLLCVFVMRTLVVEFRDDLNNPRWSPCFKILKLITSAETCDIHRLQWLGGIYIFGVGEEPFPYYTGWEGPLGQRLPGMWLIWSRDREEVILVVIPVCIQVQRKTQLAPMVGPGSLGRCQVAPGKSSVLPLSSLCHCHSWAFGIEMPLTIYHLWA